MINQTYFSPSSSETLQTTQTCSVLGFSSLSVVRLWRSGGKPKALLSEID